MRSDDQHLPFKTDALSLGGLVPSVEVSSVGADELGNIVDYLCSLGTEELILSERYRNRRCRFALRFSLIAGICNFDRFA